MGCGMSWPTRNAQASIAVRNTEWEKQEQKQLLHSALSKRGGITSQLLLPLDSL